jgi:hypothetical protein
MNSRQSLTLTKVLAIAGTVLTWFPIVAPVVLSAVVSIQSRTFRFDYLMPAELFPFAFVGGALLLWAAFRANDRFPIIALGLVLAIVWLVGGQMIAEFTGLASGEIEPTGLIFAVVVSTLVFYVLALMEVGVAGGLLVGDLFFADRGRTSTIS